MATDYSVAPWPKLLGGQGKSCGYIHDDHTADGAPLTCVRAKDHPGDEGTPARDMHLADVAGAPVFFGEPLVFDPEPAP